MILNLIWITKIALLPGIWAKSSDLNMFFQSFLHIFCVINITVHVENFHYSFLENIYLTMNNNFRSKRPSNKNSAKNDSRKVLREINQHSTVTDDLDSDL